METKTFQKSGTVNMPISLNQLAEGLRKLSRSELTTLELLVDKKTLKTIEKSLKDTKRNKIKKLKVK